MLKKYNVKYVAFVCTIIILLGCVVSYFVLLQQYKEYKKDLNSLFIAQIGVINKKYPNMEITYINELQNINQNDIKDGNTVLKKYGFDLENNVALVELEENMNNNLIINIILIFSICLILVIFFLLFLARKDRKLKELSQYIKEIENKQYKLKIEENTEEELSNLQNEVYKITVMLKEQAEQLQQDKISLSNSLSDISHQIKTPLTSVSVMIDAIKNDTQMNKEDREEFIYEISRQLSWINWLVITLLKLSKLDAGMVELKKEKIMVKTLICEVHQNMSIPLEIKNQNFIIEGNDSVSYIGDYKWSLEAITNIVKNCIEHTEENKKIKIIYSENTLYTEIKIIDEGKGIEKEDLPHIFERFYKGKNSSEDSFGIGLALAKSIVEQQKGEISVKSQIGIGSEFNIKFYK